MIRLRHPDHERQANEARLDAVDARLARVAEAHHLLRAKVTRTCIACGEVTRLVRRRCANCERRRLLARRHRVRLLRLRAVQWQ